MLRTHTCGELTAQQVGKKAVLCGWVDSRRDHGNLIFIDLRDRWGKTQLVFDPALGREVHGEGEKLRPEFVVRVQGTIEKRPQGTVNPKITTGEIELRVSQVEILNPS